MTGLKKNSVSEVSYNYNTQQTKIAKKTIKKVPEVNFFAVAIA